jgi:integrase
MSRHRTTMVRLVEEYLAARRALGFALRIEGRQLHAFGRYADARHHRGPLTVELAVAWARSSPSSSPLTAPRRLEVVRSFAGYRAAFDPATEVPPLGLLGPAHRRVAPHIYTPREIEALVQAAARLTPVDGLRPRAFATLFSLLACTGMRVSEALALSLSDVDLAAGVLRIARTKFRKARFVPLHPSATRALRRYATARDRHLGRRLSGDAFFVLDDGTQLTYSRTRTAFLALRRGLGWTQPAGTGRLPRVHDLRHTFACTRLLHWHRDRVDVHAVLPALSTYLGHTKVSDTYWYLTGIPALMGLVAQRFDRFAHAPAGGGA